MALVELRITGLAVVDQVRLDLGHGFNALTGETGSGKSVCIAGLQLVLGGKLDGDPIRPGADRAAVTAVVDDVPAALEERLAALGVPIDDYLTLHRDIPRGGRGQCRINGALVSVAVLRECGEQLIEITGQGESHRLLRPGRQLALLDAYGGTELVGLRRAAFAAVTTWREAQDRRAAAIAACDQSALALERARDVVAELRPLGITPGEDTELSAECARLRHAAGLALAAETLGDACAGGDDDPGAADRVAIAVDAARGVAGVDAELDSLVADAASIVSQLREAGMQARRLAAEMVVDEGRLAAVEQRLDTLDRVRRRYGATLEDVIASLEAAEQLLTDAQGGSRLEAIEAEVAVAAREASDRCSALSARRTALALDLEAAVLVRLRELRLPHARFRTVVRQSPDAAGLEHGGRHVACTTTGIDEVEFRLAANKDGVPLPLGQGSSGGELSRLALALRAVVADSDDCPTLVLDEIDAGVGGETAARIGELLAGIGSARQVIAVTHRAEIAARASSHLVVTKRDAVRGATAEVERVDGSGRIREIARLLSGRDTPAALARAAELLGEGSHLEVSAPRTIAPR